MDVLLKILKVSTLVLTMLLKIASSQPCGKSSFIKIGDILQPKSESGFLNTTKTSRASCTSNCERHTDCWSFYHNPTDNQCFLASRYQTVVPDTGYPDTADNRFQLFRKPGGFSTCSELLQSNPSATDGDYWLYPKSALVHHNVVKLYCNNMASGQTKAYISLPVVNSGEYPNETFQKCGILRNSLTGCPGQNGIYNYNKISVDPNTMTVTRTDKTFVTGSGVLRDYAWAGDCYTELDAQYTCGPKGSFTVNTLGTGLKVDPSLTWVTGGYKAKVVMVKSQGDAVISLTCGGYPGDCQPQTTMVLHLNPADVVDPGSATWLT